MILTGSEIAKEVINKKITISPFNKDYVNPNSYNFRLDRTLKVCTEEVMEPKKICNYEILEIPPEGYVLQPNKLYLANTLEVLGSNSYVPTYNARSSVARLGLFINLSATLLDIGFVGQITMQLYAVTPVRIYYEMEIGQIMFWKIFGEIELYHGKYQNAKGVQTTQIYKDF